MSPINNNEMHRIFNKLDKNGDEQVCINELKWLLDRTGAHTSLSELETLVGKQTLDRVDFWIFYDILIAKSKEVHHEFDDDEDQENNKTEMNDLVESFRAFDMNGDGFISCDEVESMLSRLGLWDGDCSCMIEFYDRNGDGVLDFDEFKNMMMLSNS